MKTALVVLVFLLATVDHGHDVDTFPEPADPAYLQGQRLPLYPTPYEDEPGFDCRFDGNRFCGPLAVIDDGCVFYVNDGTGVCRDITGGRYPFGSPVER